MSKEDLRRVRGKAIKPRPKPEPEPVSRNQITGGPIYMPVLAGDPDTEIRFLGAGGQVIGIVRLMSLGLDSAGRGAARFTDLSQFAGYTQPDSNPGPTGGLNADGY